MKKKTLDKNIEVVEEAALTLSINGEGDMVSATEVLSLINRYRDQIKEEKDEKTAPLKAKLEKIKAQYKEPEDKLEKASNLIRNAMKGYQQKVIENSKKKTAELAAAVSEGTMDIGAAVVEMADKPKVKVETGAGSVSFVTVKKHEVVSLKDVPIEYHLVNDVMIRKAMLAGIEVPGVRYYEEQSVRNKR